MTKPLNTIQKKLKFHCSVCQATWQLLVIRTDSLTNENTKCLNNCSQKWERLLITYCQERQIIYFACQEQEKDRVLSETKDEKEEMITKWINQIKKSQK